MFISYKIFRVSVIRHIRYSHDNGYDSLRIPNKLDVGVILKNAFRFRFSLMILLCISIIHIFLYPILFHHGLAYPFCILLLVL
jgi:hypothetical protein